MLYTEYIPECIKELQKVLDAYILPYEPCGNPLVFLSLVTKLSFNTIMVQSPVKNTGGRKDVKR